MSRSGEVWDNSAMESFFRSLKTERTAKKVYKSREQARADAFDDIERFYNPTHRDSTLGYVSPIDFEKASEGEVWVSTEPAAVQFDVFCHIPSDGGRAVVSGWGR